MWKQVRWPGPCGRRLAHHEACGCSRRVRPACLVEMASRCTMPGVTRQGFNIHSQALECSKSISSGDIVCEVGCSCGDKQGRPQVTDPARKRSGKLMTQGEEIVRRSMAGSLATGVDHWQSLKLGRHYRGWATRGELFRYVVANENIFLSTTLPRQSFCVLRGASQDLART